MTIARTGILAACLFAALGPSLATAGPARFDRIRAYLIFEDDGQLSKNIARRTDQIIANTEKGSSIQMMVDIVVKGDKNAVQEPAPMLYVWVTNPSDSHGPSLVDQGWPLGYIGLKGEVTRSIIVDHDCNPVTVHARLDHGETLGKAFEKTINITCGD